MEEKVQVIREAQNVMEVKSYLGFLSYILWKILATLTISVGTTLQAAMSWHTLALDLQRECFLC